MRSVRSLSGCLCLIGLVLLVPAATANGQLSTPEMRVSYLYHLSDFNGTIPFSDVTIYVDRNRDEVYGLVGNSVRVFGGTGMELFRFDLDRATGVVFDLVVEPSGDLLFLTYESTMGDGDRRWWIARCDYRGRPVERLEMVGLPEEFSGFAPNLIFQRAGVITLVSRQQLLAASFDVNGNYLTGHDLAGAAQLEESDDNEIFGFDIAVDGSYAFTIAARFKAFVMAPDGTVRQFGTAGSAPGKFGIISGIIVDDQGRVLIADKLRRVVMIFDADLSFLGEIGVAGAEALARPTDLIMGEQGKFYVTQARSKGVAVFRLTSLGLEHRQEGVEPTAEHPGRSQGEQPAALPAGDR